MLKSLHKDDTQLTPFVVTKNWELSNVTNEDLILMEHSGSDGPPVALEYLDYTPTGPTIAYGCNIAKEQQDLDKVQFRDGVKLSGIFYPDTDPTNPDGTYQRVVYSQVVNMFYNTFRDPTKMWGLEEIDFEKSQTKKFVADRFKLYEIPQIIFGEKMLEYSVTLFDRTTDNDYIITDDGHNNLFAGPNIFSHQQEIGQFLNHLFSGSNQYCDWYNTISIPDPPVLSGLVNACNSAVNLFWNLNDWPVTFYHIQRSADSGSTWPVSSSVNGFTLAYSDVTVNTSSMYWYRVYAENLFGTSSFSNVLTASIEGLYWDFDPDIWDLDPICGGPWAPGIINTPNIIAYDPTPPYLQRNLLSWTFDTASSLPINTFVIEKSTVPPTIWSHFLTTTPNTFSYTDTSVVFGGDYSYRMFATSASVSGSYSGVAESYVFPPPCAESMFPAQYFTESLIVGVNYDLINLPLPFQCKRSIFPAQYFTESLIVGVSYDLV